MELYPLDCRLTVCKLENLRDANLSSGIFFIGKTDEELSLVCETEYAPEKTLAREDGWRGFRIRGVIDFSLVGVLSELSAVLAENGIGIFAVSTYNTDYILVKEERFREALKALEKAGHTVARA